MAKRPLKELFNLNKVEEVSVCTKNNPPANGFTQFEIMKNSFNKSEFEDLFEELALPEYGDFVDYLNLFLEDDVNQVAYKAFIDALFFSLNEVCFDKESTKEEKALKMKDNFDKFIEEYKSSVITKSEDGKVFLNMNNKPEQENIEKQESKMDFKSFVEGIKSLIVKAEEAPEAEAVIEEVKPETQEEIIPAEEVSEEAKVEEVVEPEQAPELAEIPAVEVIEVEKTEEPIIEEPKVEIEEEIPAVEAPEVVEEPVQEEPKVEGDEEPIEEPVQKSEEPSIEEILKAKEDELDALKSKIEKAEQIQKESEIKLEKAELLKSIESEYSGLVGTSEEVLEKIYEINKSELSLETKEFALEGLKKLSAKNLEKTQEIGVEVKDEMADLPLEEKINKRAKEIQKGSQVKLSNLQAWSQAKKELTN